MTLPETRDRQAQPPVAADVVLRDGSTIHVRAVQPDDEAALQRFFESLSGESRRSRFFSSGTDLAAAARRESVLDYPRAFGLLAQTGPDARIVGHAAYHAVEFDRAEVAFAVADQLQGRGVGTLLLGELAEVAAAHGIRVFEAVVLSTNYRMLEAFRESGFAIEVTPGPGELRIAFPTGFTAEAIDRFERREQIAAVNAVRAFLEPRSVAVIGASRTRATVGGAVFHNLLAAEFAGPVYPVNPAAAVVQSVPCYPSVEAIPGPVDLAVLVVPAAQISAVAEQCGRKGVRSLVVISSGFAEVGDAGRRLQHALLESCRAWGMRLIGPNCLGIINTAPDIRLDATFGPHMPPAGRVAFASQSGALGLAAIDYAGSLGLGISSFLSVGNKADISSNDLLSYWEADPQTDVILLYLESFGNPRKFARIAQRVGRSKPIIAVKSGRSGAGARATASHTGALLAASDVTVDALFRQAGVMRASTVESLFGVASLLAAQPVPVGRRVAIVTNAGGPGILCADACEAEGLTVPVLAEATQARLRGFLPTAAGVGNPVDMIASASAEHYQRTIATVAADPGIDAVIAIFLQPLATRAAEIAVGIVAAAREVARRVPILSVFMSAEGVPAELRTVDVRIPSYAFPESAAIALAHAARYGEWRARPLAPLPQLAGIRGDEAAALVARALGRPNGWLEPDEVAQLLDCYGVPMAEQRVVATPEAAGQAAERMGGRVALKGIAPSVLHKTEAGLVRVPLEGAAAAHQAAEEMAAAARAAGHELAGFLVQRAVAGGVEMLVGVVHDPHFGPVVACGAGGVLVEVLKDVTVRLSPITAEDATEMVHELRSYPLLTGFRGAPACDVGGLTDLLVRIGRLADDRPEIAELDCNPVMVGPAGAVVVDARVRVEAVPAPLPLGARA